MVYTSFNKGEFMDKNQHEIPTPLFWNYKQASVALAMPLGTLYSLVSDGRIPHNRIGPKHVLFPIEAVLTWINSNPVAQWERKPVKNKSASGLAKKKRASA